MTHWVLIWILSWTNSSTGSAIFDNKAACEQARQWLIKEANGMNLKAVCLETKK